MKQRFSSLDIIAHELAASLITLRVSNIYDLSSRIFLLKFAKPEHREQLIVDSGYRCHLSAFARSTAAAPSAFVSRLRKSLRTRRVTGVDQVGTDRVIDITFSDGLYHLFLEFYAGGNIILTDNEYTIVALLRTVSEGAEHEQFRVGVKYNLSLRQNYGGIPDLTKDRVRDGIQQAVARAQEQEGQKKKFKRKAGDELRRALATSITEYPPVLLEHGLQRVGFNKETPVAEVLANDGLLDQLMLALEEARKTVQEITNTATAKGFILAKSDSKSETVENDGQNRENVKLMYDDFQPFRPAQFEGRSDVTILEYEGFNKTVDEFFSSIEGQKLESKLHEKEEAAKRKLQNAREEHEKRIGGLQQVQELNVQRAQAIEANLDRVEEVRAAVNGLVAQGMDWEDIGKLIEMEQKRQNSVALTIKLPLKLHENTATMLLAGYGAEEEEDEDDMADESASESSDSEDNRPQSKHTPADRRIPVDIDLAQSAWANSRQFYDNRKAAASKQDRTLQASSRALKSTEQKITADLKKGLKHEKAVLRPVRKQMWFEKFNWFISSDGYLVLAGKDAQQNELLYKRHLKKGDVYVHADLHGAASIVIKNNPATPDAPFPPSTLSQAGSYTVCTSNAWESKAIMSAWWVNADQVTKTAPTGEYLTTGSFMIRGKKNFLPPAQLLLGFAVLYQISEESKARHKKHRVEEPASGQAPVLGEETAEDDDMDDDFPDARGDVGQDSVRRENITAEPEDDDDDFPDAQENVSDDDELPDAHPNGMEGNVNDEGDAASGHSSDDDNDPDTKPRSNPLQANGAGRDREDENSSSEEDERSQAEDNSEDSVKKAEQTAQPDGVKHLSAAARRRLKKGTTSVPSDDNNRPGTPDTRSSKSQGDNKPNQPIRGKRGKAKKLATKYADQDEEDRELAMSLLGSKKPEITAAETNDTPKETIEEARARRREQHLKIQKAGLEAEEIRRLNLDEGIPEPEEDDGQVGSLSSILDGLVGTPLPGDEILEAIPVSAPWAALGRYKYKAKMQPGTVKKGKAVREVLGRWNKDATEPKKVDSKSEDIERIWPREAELIKAWKEAEVFGVLPVKSVRVMMAGGGEGAKGGKGGGGKGKGGGRGGRGSKKK
ncbi:Nuclear export mediator factor Nemf [Sphaceloma murrayae]|uniref:Ribosome quality control complex subunit 2 n=1 Tax=Sphaceloma murrayae TaxID=2082308 RepID=A0A2K1QGT6_9PEZI|nr:Nuclear export mediator factor Nemf [Sphaceloma murrayae]